MARKSTANTISLKVLIDEDSFLKSFEKAIQASPKAIDKVAKAANPLEAIFDKSVRKLDQLNRRLEKAAKLSAQIKIADGQVSKQRKPRRTAELIRQEMQEADIRKTNIGIGLRRASLPEGGDLAAEIRHAEKEASDAFDRLIGRRNDLLEIMASGVLTQEQELKLVKELDLLTKITDERRDKALRGQVSEQQRLNDEIRDQIILSRSFSGRELEARKRLTEIREQENKVLRDQTASLERLAIAQKRVNDINMALRGRGTGRRSLSNQRILQGPDPFGVMLDASRIAQDAAFGWVGIANNVGPFMEQFTVFYTQFQELPKLSQRVAAALGTLAKATFFSPIGWIFLIDLFGTLIMRKDAILNFFSELLDLETATERAARNLRKEIEKAALTKSADIGNDFRVISEQIEIAQENLTRFNEERQKILDTDFKARLPKREMPDNPWLRFGIYSEGNEEVERFNRDIESTEKLIESLMKRMVDFRATLEAQMSAVRANTLGPIEAQAQQRMLEAEAEFKRIAVDLAETDQERYSAKMEMFEAEANLELERLAIEKANAEFMMKSWEEQYQDKLAKGETFSEEQVAAYNRIAAALKMELDVATRNISLVDEKLRVKRNQALKELNDALKQQTEEWIKAEQQIEDVAYAVQRSIIETTQSGLAERVALITLDAQIQEKGLRRQLEAFVGTEDQKLQYARFIEEQIVELHNSVGVKITEAIRENGIDQARQRREIADLQLEIARRNAGKILGLQGQIAAEEERSRREQARIQAEIEELRLGEQNEYTKERIRLRELLIEAEKKYSEREIEIIKNDAAIRDSELLLEMQRDVTEANLAYQESRIRLIFSGRRENKELRKLEEERLIAQEEFVLERKLKNAEEIEDEEKKLQAIIAAYKAFNLAIAGIRADINNQAQEEEFKILGEGGDRISQFIQDQVSVFEDFSRLRYENFVAKRKQELIEQGHTEDEAQRLAEEAGQKQLEQQKAWAKRSIVIATANAAMLAFESGMRLPLPAPFPQIAAFGAAAAAIAFGRQQYKAVDLDNIADATGRSGGQFSIGEVTPPGVQDPNVLNYQPMVGGARDAGTSQMTPAGVIHAGLEDMAVELSNLRADISNLMDKYANRPQYIDVPERNALRIMQSAERYRSSTLRR